MSTSINKSQAQAIADGFLDNIGTIQGGENQLPVLNAMLADGAKVFIENAVANLEKSKAISSGELATSLEFSVTQRGTLYIVSVGYPANSKAAQYYDYVNKGVAGTEGTNGATGDYKYKNPYPSKKMATQLLLWYRLNGNKARTSAAQGYTYGNIEEKGKALGATVKRSDNLKALAYGTATNIKKRGLKPTRFFDDAMEQTFNEQFYDALQVALGAEVKIMIKKIFNDLDNGNNS